MKSLVLLPLAAILLTSCTSVFNAVHVKYNGKTRKFNSTVGYELRMPDPGETLTMRAGPSRRSKPVAEIKDGRFVGVAASSKNGGWFPLKILESKGVVVGYVPVSTSEKLVETKHKFSPINH